MDTLEQARAEIDAVDAQLAALFERRMAAVLSVAQYKQAHGLPILTPRGRRRYWKRLRPASGTPPSGLTIKTMSRT